MPARMMKIMKNKFRKCDNRNHEGNPDVIGFTDTGAPG
jgi:hypothetical protein